GGVIGTFAGVTSNLAFLTPTLTYDPNDVFLTLNRNDITFASVAQTPNQRAVAGALDRSPLFSPLVQAVVNLTGASALGAFDALSGEVHGTVQTTIVDDSRYIRQAALWRLRHAPRPSAPRPGPGWRNAGVGRSLPPGGFALGTARRPDQGPAARPSGATPRPHLLGARCRRLGQDRQRRHRRRCRPQPRRLLHRLRSPLRRVARGLGGGLHQFERERERAGEFRQHRHPVCRGLCRHELLGVEFPLRRDVRLEHDRHQPRNRLPRLFRAGDHALRRGRSASVRRTRLRPDLRRHRGRAVRGAGLGASRYRKLHRNRWRERAYRHREDIGYSTLGARVATYYLLQNGMALIPRASVAWQHAFGEVTPTAALSFQSTGAGFNILGVPIARDAALVEAGGDLQLTAQAKIGVSYAGQLANSAHDHSVR